MLRMEQNEMKPPVKWNLNYLYDGVHVYCMQCIKIAQKEYYEVSDEEKTD